MPKKSRNQRFIFGMNGRFRHQFLKAIIKNKMPYNKAIEYLFNLQKFGIKFGLSKTENLLKAFGNPHLGQNYIHIAGTNGKGSVAAFMGSILQEAGIQGRPVCVASPGPVHGTLQDQRYREISREKTDCIDPKNYKMRSMPTNRPPFLKPSRPWQWLYFAREKTDIAIMEVGMGGRLDATNVITPLVTGITNISMEHQEYLGKPAFAILPGKRPASSKKASMW